MNKDKDPRDLNVTQSPLVIYPEVKVSDEAEECVCACLGVFHHECVAMISEPVSHNGNKSYCSSPARARAAPHYPGNEATKRVTRRCQGGSGRAW